MASSFLRFLDNTQRRITVGRTPLDEWSAHRRDLYLTTHNTHNRQTSMTPVEMKPTISAGERPQTYALDRAATGTGWLWFLVNHKWFRILEKESNVTACLLLTHSIVHKTNAMKYLSFSVWPRIPTHCRCRELLRQLVTLSDTHTHTYTHTHATHTHTLGRATLEEGSDRRRDLYLREKILTTDIHAHGGVRIL